MSSDETITRTPPSGERENAMMQMFAGQLSDEDMADLAAYYAGLGGE